MVYKLGSYGDYIAIVNGIVQQIYVNLGKRGSAIICTVAVYLIFQGWMLLVWAPQINATSVLAVLRVFHTLGSPDGKHVVAVFFMLAADLSIFGALANLGYIRILLFLPQVFLLFLMAGGGIWAAGIQHYFDGTPKPWQHLLADQDVYAVLMFIHIFSSLSRVRVR